MNLAFLVYSVAQELADLASRTRRPLAEVALGQGQADTALVKLKEAMTVGSWLCLRNLHLMTFWVAVLVEELRRGEPHPDFRLWLTAEPHPKFPAALSEACLKVDSLPVF